MGVVFQARQMSLHRKVARLRELELRTLRGHGDAVQGVSYSPDGRILAAASPNGTVKVWDLITRQEVLILHADTGIMSVAYSPDGRQLAMGLADRNVKIWDATPDTDGLDLDRRIDAICRRDDSQGSPSSP
jgi:WD40 repeat protein